MKTFQEKIDNLCKRFENTRNERIADLTRDHMGFSNLSSTCIEEMKKIEAKLKFAYWLYDTETEEAEALEMLEGFKATAMKALESNAKHEVIAQLRYKINVLTTLTKTR